MTGNKTQLNTIIVSGPEYCGEITTALQSESIDSIQSIHVGHDLSHSDEIVTVVVGSGIGRDSQVDLMLQARELRCDILLHVTDFEHLNRAMSTNVGGVEFIEIAGGERGRPAMLTQRTLDLTLALLACVVVLVPALLIIGPLIAPTSRGSVCFPTTVVRKHRQRFTWRKFRSMRAVRPGDEATRREIVARAIRKDIPQSVSESTKIVDNERLTAIGRFLRKTSLDKLPHLINVIQGSMSLVGPRPCLPDEYDAYNGWERNKLALKPGITGVCQLYGRSRVQFDEMVFMDNCGMLKRSVIGDLKLVAFTLPIALLGKGAE